MRKVAVVTTGFFDGVHLGHRHVLETVVSSARERGEEAVVVTFWPHPRTVLQQDARDFRLLSSLEEKKALLLRSGIDRVEVIPFTRTFAALTAAEYLSLLRDRFGASVVVMGYDNRIGSDRKTAASLAPGVVTPEIVPAGAIAAGLGAVTLDNVPAGAIAAGAGAMTPENVPAGAIAAGMDAVTPDNVPAGAISSTRIRKLLEEGKVEDACQMLGYRYGLYGVVVAGNRVGRTIGFPTANMQLYEPLKLVPENGVYAVEVDVLGRQYRGMCNIGLRPTVGGGGRTIETHILNFNEDIYGLPLRIRFVRRIRDEIRFPSLEALRLQLVQDADACR